MSPGFGDDQRRVVRRDDHAVGKHDVVGDLTRASIGRHHRDRSWPEVFLTKAEADAVDEDVVPAVDGDFVPALAKRPKVGVSDKRSVRLVSQESILARDKKTAIRQEVDAVASRLWSFGDDLAFAVQVNGPDLLSAPVAEPETARMPPGRLSNDQATDQALQSSSHDSSARSDCISARN